MNNFLDDEIVAKINSSHKLTDEERRQLIKEISEKKKLPLVTLIQGFPSEKENPQDYKRPIEKKWPEISTPDNVNFNFSELKDRAGILCGEKSGIIVLDIDNLQKFKKWAKEREIENPIPTTFTVNTRLGTDRNHYYFKFPTDGKEYKNRSVRETFDIKSNEGQVLCPGSIHPETHQPYTVVNNHEIAEAPEWLRDYSHDMVGFE